MSGSCDTNSQSGSISAQDWLSSSLKKEQGAGQGQNWNEYAFWIAVVIAYAVVGYLLCPPMWNNSL